ncbi:MAG: SAM-dependent methyltransferase [Lachnospiraceae bacterium]|nr:SAM-dependent methyltransferase [Lachnospiraceae bacterium]
MNFFIEYLKHPFKIGAVAPSSRRLAEKMMMPVNFDECDCIIEYGPGTGTFTKEIIKRKKRETIFLVIEQNEEFYEKLRREYMGEENVILIHGDASRVQEYMKQYKISHADYIVSGLPFASLPNGLCQDILKATKVAVGKKGAFITFQYTLFKKHIFAEHFRIKDISFEMRNLPPAYVLTMGA